MKGHSTSPDQVTIYFNPGNTTHEKAVAHAKGTGKEVLSIPYKDAPSAYNVWTKIYEELPFPSYEFFDSNDELYGSLVNDEELAFEDWYKVAVHNPNLIDVAVALSGEKVVFLNRQTEVYRLQELGPDANDTDIAPANRAGNEVDDGGVMLDR